MLNMLDALMDNTYRLNLPLPVVSVTELNLNVEKDSVYKGSIEIVNSSEGQLIGLIESRSNILKIKEDIIKENKCIINFELDSNSLNIGHYDDTILITYNGGEILIPVIINVHKMTEVKNKKQSKGLCAKKKKKKISFAFNRKSYNPGDSGLLTIFNPSTNKIKIKLNSEEEYIQFNETEFEVSETKTVQFSFKITKLDRMLGRVPLKTQPKIELKFNAQIITKDEQIEKTFSIFITDLNKLPSKNEITTEKSYRHHTIDICKSFCDISLSGGKEKNLEPLFEKLGSLINYDKTNIYLRLFYCYLALEAGNKNLVLKELNNLDRYLLYYDNEHMEISDILMLFLQVCQGDSVQDLINRWASVNKNHWIKVLLKNKYITNKTMCYEAYKNVYLNGHKNFFVFLGATWQINQIPYVPSGHDSFYKALLLWALRKQAIGPKWLKKLGNSYQILTRYDNINSIIAEGLYTFDKSKSILMLICSVYLSEGRVDIAALTIYEKVLTEKMHISGLEAGYIKAAYHCNEMINFDYIKIIFNIEELEPLYKDYFYLNLLIQESRYKNLYNIHSNSISHLNTVRFKCLTVPEITLYKAEYIKYLLSTNQVSILISLCEAGKLKDLPNDAAVSLIKGIYNDNKELAVRLSNYSLSKGCYDHFVLELVGDNYIGTLNSLIDINNKLCNHGYYSKKLQEQILYKGILTRSSFKQVMQVFLNYSNTFENSKICEHMFYYIAGQIIIEEVQPPIGIIKLLEEKVKKTEDNALYLSLLKSYIKCDERDEELIKSLIHSLVESEIIFSWYTGLVKQEELGEKIRIYHYFEYNSKPNQIVDFYYRLDNDDEYRCVRMKHVALGMYIANIILFYNERVQYYIVETDNKGRTDIKLSDEYVKVDLVEVENTECLFDLINTVEISKVMNDETSIEEAIDNYLNFTKQEIDKLTIL